MYNRKITLDEEHQKFVESNFDSRRLTIYVRNIGLLGWTKLEVTWLHVYKSKGNSELYYVFKLRRARMFRRGSVDICDIVILLGWSHPDFPEKFNGSKLGVGQDSTYPPFSEKWDIEFSKKLSQYIKSLPLTQLLFDYDKKIYDSFEKTNSKFISIYPSDVIKKRYLLPDFINESENLKPIFVSYYHDESKDLRAEFETSFGKYIKSASIYPGEIESGVSDQFIRKQISKRISKCKFLFILLEKNGYSRKWIDWEIRAALTIKGQTYKSIPIATLLGPDMNEIRTFVNNEVKSVSGKTNSKEILRYSDDIYSSTLKKFGYTLPVRIIDNLLSGYGILAGYPREIVDLVNVLNDSLNTKGNPISHRKLMQEDFNR